MIYLTFAAVLLALKSLQDKIRQLESDRSNAERNLRTLTHETAQAREASRALGRDRPTHLDRSPRWREPVVENASDRDIDKENRGSFGDNHRYSFLQF